MLSMMNLRPVESHFGVEALDELEFIKAAIAEEGSTAWVLLQSLSLHPRYFEVLCIREVPGNPDYSELLILVPEYGPEAIRPPCYGLYDHEELSIERYEQDGVSWWKLSENADMGYFNALLFILPQGEDPSTFFG